MEPITRFVTTYGPDIIKPRPEFSLQRLCFKKVDAMFDQLDDVMKVNFLVHCASLTTWYEKSHMCTPWVMNTAAKVLLGKLGFIWINEKNAFNKLLGHLFDQAIRNPKVTKKEIDALIQVKRRTQLPVLVLPEKTLSIFERSVLRLSYAWRYTIPLNHNRQLLPNNIPVSPLVLDGVSYLFMKYYFLPDKLNYWVPRGCNFLINHLPGKVFPIAFKIMDTCWWLDFLPYFGQGFFNPTATRVIYFTQKIIKVVANVFSVPAILTKATGNFLLRATNVIVPALEKLEDYSEATRYKREIDQVKQLWINHAKPNPA